MVSPSPFDDAQGDLERVERSNHQGMMMREASGAAALLTST